MSSMSLSETPNVPSERASAGRSASRARASNGRWVKASQAAPALTLPARPARAEAPPAPTGDPEARSPRHLPDDRYLDREQSWVLFNERVLELAEDESIPLLERVRFLAIFASNLDEFFMVRVAGLTRRMVAGFPVEGAGLQMASQVLRGTLAAAGEATQRHAEVFREVIRPALAKAGIAILRWRDLTPDERHDLSELFRKRIYPVLTPLVV